MADYKRIIKNVLFIAFVPSVVVAGYYGYQYYKKRKEEAEANTLRQDNDGVKTMSPMPMEKKMLKDTKKVNINDIVKPTETNTNEQ